MAKQRDEKGHFVKGNTEGNRWKKGESGNPAGRPPKIIAQLNRLLDQDVKPTLSQQDYDHICMWLLERTKGELQAIMKSAKTPVFMVVLISTFLKDIKKGSMYSFNQLLDRFRPPEQQEASTTINFITGFDLEGEEEKEEDDQPTFDVGFDTEDDIDQ